MHAFREPDRYLPLSPREPARSSKSAGNITPPTCPASMSPRSDGGFRDQVGVLVDECLPHASGVLLINAKDNGLLVAVTAFLEELSDFLRRQHRAIVEHDVALTAGSLIDVKSWDGLKAGLLVALSVMAAGVLVRLARGLPFTSVDHYEVEEVRQMTGAVDQIMRSLKLLILIVLIGMVVLIVALPLQSAIESQVSAGVRAWVGYALSGLIGLVLSYVCSRMWQVIKGDQELTTLQSKFVVRAVERKQAKQFEEQIANTDSPKFKPPVDYGKLIN
jgi:hypothetical protein